MRDFVSQYQSFKEYHSTAGGWLLLAGEQPVSGASCYLASRQGFAIQVQTDEQYQGHGDAKIVSAALILEGLRRGLYPDWDADNPVSGSTGTVVGLPFAAKLPDGDGRGQRPPTLIRCKNAGQFIKTQKERPNSLHNFKKISIIYQKLPERQQNREEF